MEQKERVVIISEGGYQRLVDTKNGKGLHWETDITGELPIKMRPSGIGSEKP